MIPVLTPGAVYAGRMLLVALAAAAVFAAGYMSGHDRATARCSADKAQADLAVAQTDAARSHATVQVVTRYVDRAQAMASRAEDIRRSVSAYVEPSSAACAAVPGGFRVLHDAAATGAALPGAASAADAPPVALETVAVTVVDNYAACSANAEQLTALQDWVRTQQETAP